MIKNLKDWSDTIKKKNCKHNSIINYGSKKNRITIWCMECGSFLEFGDEKVNFDLNDIILPSGGFLLLTDDVLDDIAVIQDLDAKGKIN